MVTNTGPLAVEGGRFKLKRYAGYRLPDFIIAGAMKCGTSSLHRLLSHHPDIFIPKHEIHFYNLDDINQHPDFYFFQEGRWHYPRFEENEEKYLKWYQTRFEAGIESRLWGEDSTTYLASSAAIRRIAQLNPDAKLIVMLRDPADRAYSHYWHTVRSGRAIWDFERTLQLLPGTMVQRSLYKAQVECLLAHVPRRQVYFVLLEEFAENSQRELDRVCEFLDVASGVIDCDAVSAHQNRAKVPRNLKLQLWRNRLLRQKAGRKYVKRLPDVPATDAAPASPFNDWFERVHRYVNPLLSTRPPPMLDATRSMLNYYFAKQNDGLDRLIDKKIDKYWYRG